MAYFIAFEGPDGSGKTTILKKTEDLLKNRYPVKFTREPGGTETSEKIREILLDNDLLIGAKTEALLYAASRAQHTEEFIRPCLERGIHVFTDRYILSSLAYQGKGRDLGIETIARLNEYATGGLSPDYTFFFDVDPVTVLKRKGEDPDRLEAEGDGFHQKVYRGYCEILERNRDRDDFIVIDASRSVDEVFEETVRRIKEILEADE